ncbi:MAG: 4Fe-4S dicluster domain-containing protein [Nitrospirae bacterium]|nr:4Fe-4S dicluster domain-containing protein [Nitrospirota bacterium]
MSIKQISRNKGGYGVKQSRRDILKLGAITIAGVTIPLTAFELLTPEALASTKKEHGTGKRWGFVVNATKCVGCGMCVKACKTENEVPMDIKVSRTWVERYIQLKDGEVIIDSPEEARNGFIKNDPRGRTIKEEDISKGFFVPKLCNQCEKPSCVQVCPVGATYKTEDGVVLVDRTWCIGCAYCVQNCPYGARFIHPVHMVAEKCTFCYHRITKGMNSACMDACAFGARKIGDINDPNSEVYKLINSNRVMVLKPEYGNEPMVFYIGLDHIVR